MKRSIPLFAPLLALSSLATQASAGELSFAQLEKSTTLGVDKELTSLSFDFTNETKEAITISKISAGCDGCLEAKVEGGSKTIAAGAKGKILGTFKAASYTGSVEKGISLWTAGKKTGAPTTTLICKFTIPKMVATKYRRLSWKKNEAGTSKTITFTTANRKPLPKTEIANSDKNFTSKLSWDNSTKIYSLQVTAKETHQNHFGIIKIKTGLKATRNKTIRFYLVAQP